MNKQLAKVSGANLEVKERGILNFWIYVDYEDFGSQGIGGITLDEFDKEKERRVGTAYGCEMIRRILLEFQVNDFAELKGKHIWVIGDGESFSFKPKGVQSLSVDNKNSSPLMFDDVYEEFKE